MIAHADPSPRPGARPRRRRAPGGRHRRRPEPSCRPRPRPPWQHGPAAAPDHPPHGGGRAPRMAPERRGHAAPHRLRLRLFPAVRGGARDGRRADADAGRTARRHASLLVHSALRGHGAGRLSRPPGASAGGPRTGRARHLPESSNAHAKLLFNDPATALIARSRDLDLLVVGSRAKGPLGAIWSGSVSNRVMREAACPVIVVPRGVVPWLSRAGHVPIRLRRDDDRPPPPRGTERARHLRRRVPRLLRRAGDHGGDGGDAMQNALAHQAGAAARLAWEGAVQDAFVGTALLEAVNGVYMYGHWPVILVGGVLLFRHRRQTTTACATRACSAASSASCSSACSRSRRPGSPTCRSSTPSHATTRGTGSSCRPPSSTSTPRCRASTPAGTSSWGSSSSGRRSAGCCAVRRRRYRRRCRRGRGDGEPLRRRCGRGGRDRDRLSASVDMTARGRHTSVVRISTSAPAPFIVAHRAGNDLERMRGAEAIGSVSSRLTSISSPAASRCAIVRRSARSRSCGTAGSSRPRGRRDCCCKNSRGGGAARS